MEKWLTRISIFIAIGITFLRVGLDMYCNEYIHGSVADDSYYYSVGKSLFTNGIASDISVSPTRESLSSHWGIVVVYGFLNFIGFNFIQVSIITLLLGAIFHLLSFFPLKKMAMGINLKPWIPAFIVTILMFTPTYYSSILGGRTETFFFPLTIYYVCIVMDWLKTNKNLWLLLIISIFLFAFRLQAIIVFASVGVSLILIKNYRKKIISFTALTIIAIGFVISINYSITESLSSRGEQAVLNELTENAFDKLIANFLKTIHFLSEPGNSFLFELSALITVIFIIVIIWEIRKKRNFINVFSISLIVFAFASFIVGMPISVRFTHLRYIAYVAPFLLLLLNEAFSENKWVNNKLYVFAILILLSGSLKNFQSELRNTSFLKEKNKRSTQRFEELSNLKKEITTTLYGYNIVHYELNRVVFSTMEKQIVLIDSSQQLNNKKGYLTAETRYLPMFESHIDSILYTFKINQEFFIAKLN